jgi:ADP-ribosylglycohydrolase
METLNQDRRKRMLDSVQGLSVGDAFGERFFGHRRVVAELRLRGPDTLGALDLRTAGEPISPPSWRWTDDTAMALCIVSTLETHGTIDGDFLARRFAQQYSAEPRRGYGPAMHSLLPQLRNVRTRQQAARRLFGGQGSFGNGAAMRVAPLGAFFADDLDFVSEQARLAAEVTHAHKEGIAGAVAVALAAAMACRYRGSPPPPMNFWTRSSPAHLRV